MNFVYPEMLPHVQFMPFMTYYPYPPMNPLQMQELQAALQYNTFCVVPHILPSIPLDQYHAFSTDLNQDWTNQSEWGPHRTAASGDNHLAHASHSAITSDRHTISHHSQVGDFGNTWSGSAGGPPSSRMSTLAQNRASARRGRRKCDNLLQYVVAAKKGRPWKRRKTGGQPIPVTPAGPVPSTSLPSIASTSASMVDATTESMNGPGEVVSAPISGDVDVQGEPVEMGE